MGEIHELLVLALSLVWFAGATPERGLNFPEIFGALCVRQFKARKNVFRANFVLQTCHPKTLMTNLGTTPITILAVNSDHGLSFAGEEARTMV